MQKIYTSLIWNIQIEHAAKKVQRTEVYKVEHIVAMKINNLNVSRIYFNDL